MGNAKIVITAAADQDLEEMKNIVNEDKASRVTKTELASWIISFFKAAYFTKHVQTIRGDHFDEIAHMEEVVRQMKAARNAGGSIEVGGLLAPVIQRQKNQTTATGTKRTQKIESEPKE
ncbi:MAG: hypothetical protein KF681_04715 [Bdellovibrionaceae bacterium]|nr:hypothetical protein [Pseudobdellovibrionaceae bacterium]